MSSKLYSIFSEEQPIIGMVHLPASVGQPQALGARSVRELISGVKKDILALQNGGVNGVLFCNESDLPYTNRLKSEVAAWAAFFVGAVFDSLKVPHGINLLWDPIASIETAAATDAKFVREVMCGTFASDMGLLAPDPAQVLETRTRLRADHIALFTNIIPEFASALENRTVAQRAKAASYFGFDAILISGPVAGEEFSIDDLMEAKTTAKDVPVIANTGVRAANIKKTLEVADGVIVGSSLKIDGKTFNHVDENRVKELMQAARK